MFECRRTRKRLVEYLDGELPAQVARHLERCAACRRKMEALQSSRTALRSLSRGRCPDAVWDRVSARLRNVETETSRAWRLLSRPVYAFLVGLVLFVILGAGLSVRPLGAAPSAVWMVVSSVGPVGVHVEGQR